MKQAKHEPIATLGMDWRAVFLDVVSHAAADAVPLSCVKSLYSYAKKNLRVPEGSLRSRLRQVQRVLMKPSFQHALGTWVCENCMSDGDCDEFYVHALVSAFSLTGNALVVEVLASVVAATQSMHSSQLSDAVTECVKCLCLLSSAGLDGKGSYDPRDPLCASTAAVLECFAYGLKLDGIAVCELSVPSVYLYRNPSIHSEIVARAGGMLDRVLQSLPFTVAEVMSSFVVASFVASALVRPAVLSTVLSGVSAAGDDIIVRKPFLDLLESVASPAHADLFAGCVDIIVFWLHATSSPVCIRAFKSFLSIAGAAPGTFLSIVSSATLRTPSPFFVMCSRNQARLV
jgi:hypothetical protein